MGDQALNPNVTTTEPGTVEPSSPTVQPSPGSPPATPANTEHASATPLHRMLKDDEPIPTGEELVALPAKTLKSRLDRYSKSQLREHFGVDSYDEISSKLDKLAEMEREAEERQLAELTEVERERQLRARAEQRATQWERRYTQHRETQAMREIDSEINSVLNKHFDEMWIEGMIGRLATYLGTKSEKELRNVGKVVDEWCRKEVTRSPHLGLGYAEKVAAANAPPPPAPTPERMAIPFSNGAQAQRSDQGGSPVTEKTPAPNRTNSMSESEWKAYKQQHGIQY